MGNVANDTSSASPASETRLRALPKQDEESRKPRPSVFDLSDRLRDLGDDLDVVSDAISHRGDDAAIAGTVSRLAEHARALGDAIDEFQSAATRRAAKRRLRGTGLRVGQFPRLDVALCWGDKVAEPRKVWPPETIALAVKREPADVQPGTWIGRLDCVEAELEEQARRDATPAVAAKLAKLAREATRANPRARATKGGAR